jgi:hypothetical protein
MNFHGAGVDERFPIALNRRWIRRPDPVRHPQIDIRPVTRVIQVGRDQRSRRQDGERQMRQVFGDTGYGKTVRL